MFQFLPSQSKCTCGVAHGGQESLIFSVIASQTRWGRGAPVALSSCGSWSKLPFRSSFSLVKDNGVCDMHRTAED